MTGIIAIPLSRSNQFASYLSSVACFNHYTIGNYLLYSDSIGSCNVTLTSHHSQHESISISSLNQCNPVFYTSNHNWLFISSSIQRLLLLKHTTPLVDFHNLSLFVCFGSIPYGSSLLSDIYTVPCNSQLIYNSDFFFVYSPNLNTSDYLSYLDPLYPLGITCSTSLGEYSNHAQYLERFSMQTECLRLPFPFNQSSFCENSIMESFHLQSVKSYINKTIIGSNCRPLLRLFSHIDIDLFLASFFLGLPQKNILFFLSTMFTGEPFLKPSHSFDNTVFFQYPDAFLSLSDIHDRLTNSFFQSIYLDMSTYSDLLDSHEVEPSIFKSRLIFFISWHLFSIPSL